ncbi:MAG: redoxin domain-containing protein [Chitinophagaceae bacterium]|nr:redoxin domain-containing protein [Chitinophagaceae bacterium]
MRNKSFFIFSLFFLSVMATGEQVPKTSPSGYRIPITITPLKNTKVYLGSYFGKSMTLVDSAKIDANSKGVFQGAKKLTGGIYFVVSPGYTILFELLMDAQQQFSIVADTAQKEKAVISGSADNDLFKQYSIFSTEKGKLLQQLEAAFKAATNKADSTRIREQIIKTDKALRDYQENIIKTKPQSLLATLFSAMKRPTPPAIPVIKGKPDSTYPYYFVKNHYWDGISFNDDRLLRTPFFEPKIDEYYKNYVSPNPDSIIQEVKMMLLYARSGKEIYPYLLTKFTNKYMTPEFMGQDKVFVYLFENFYAKGDTLLLNPASRKTVTERAYSLMANQLGNPAPVLDLTDTLGKTVSLYAQKSPFTLVVFWDPNCGHCKEELPRIDSIYRAKWKAKGVSVYSVNIYENEIVAWKQFLKEKNISKEWVQAYQTKAARDAEQKAGVPNYRQLYDIFKTPTLYLLDKDKRIMAKQLSIEQFDALLEAKQ